MAKNLPSKCIYLLYEIFQQYSLNRSISVAVESSHHCTYTKKQNSDRLNPESYRPISLTGVLGNELEKILNERLTWNLEYSILKNYNFIETYQSALYE